MERWECVYFNAFKWYANIQREAMLTVKQVVSNFNTYLKSVYANSKTINIKVTIK